MNRIAHWMAGVALAAAAAGCSLILSFSDDGRPCDDAGRCTAGYRCESGLCVPALCDGLSCPTGATCRDGQCVPCTDKEMWCDDSQDDDCDGLSDCTDPDCRGRACNDQNPCTSGEYCPIEGGPCSGGTNKRCSTPGSPCQAAPGRCEPSTGQCVYGPADAGKVCDDQSACTTADRCDGLGHCVGGPSVTCTTPPSDCHETTGSCDSTTGCRYPPKPTGTACNDRNTCTTGETCDGQGHCGGGTGQACNTPPSSCYLSTGSCADGGGCVYPNAPAGTACSDGNGCTVNDACDGKGVCVGGPTCPTTDSCRVGTCTGGSCQVSNRVDGTACGSHGADRCCGGSCTDISVDTSNCGGCGNACAAGFACESVADTPSCTWAPASTAGRCRCTGNLHCPLGQMCTTSQTYSLRCAPAAASQCGTNQAFHDDPICPNWCSY